MRTFESQIIRVGSIMFPQFAGVRIMMMPFRLESPADSIPDSLAAWREALGQLCRMGPAKKGVAYLTIDEALVRAGETHRRPGLHVDGIGPRLAAGSWGGGGWAGGDPSPDPKPEKPTEKPKKGGRTVRTSAPWRERRGMIVAASHVGCRGWHQAFVGFPGSNGDCAHLAAQRESAKEVVMRANQAYWCAPLAVHESLPVPVDVRRQFVRISMPNDCPWYAGYTENPLGIVPTGPIHASRAEFMAYRPM